MRYRLALGLSAGLIAFTAPGALAASEDCEADLAALIASPVFVGGLPPEAAEAARGWRPREEDGLCVLTDFEFPLSTAPTTLRQTASVDRAAWTASWDGGRRTAPPVELALDISGVNLVYSGAEMDPAIAYQMKLTGQQATMRGGLDYTRDPATGALDIRRLEIAAGGERAVLSARVDDLDIAAMIETQPSLRLDKLLAMRLSSLDLRLENRSFFEVMSSLWVYLVYPRMGETPEAAVEAAKSVAGEQLRALPDYLTTTETREALAALVDSLPHPTGEVRLRVDAENGLAAQNLLPYFLMGMPSWQVLEQPLTGVRLEAEWVPADQHPGE